jgi:hypothetical protein
MTKTYYFARLRFERCQVEVSVVHKLKQQHLMWSLSLVPVLSV